MGGSSESERKRFIFSGERSFLARRPSTKRRKSGELLLLGSGESSPVFLRGGDNDDRLLLPGMPSLIDAGRDFLAALTDDSLLLDNDLRPEPRLVYESALVIPRRFRTADE